MILTFADPAAAAVVTSGGKGMSLARLFQGGFPVPPGFVVPAAAYVDFVAQDARLAAAIDALPYEEAVRLREECALLRDRLVSLPLPPTLADAVRAATRPLLAAHGAVAVRSSSTMEDLAGAAFAGQHDTYLGIRSEEATLDAIRRCFASLWEDRAAHYRHAHGFDPHRATMAVVVQALVPSEVAGVAFGMNPITGNLGEVVVNASWGLGETVVSGAGDVDQFVLDKHTGAVRERTIGDKARAILATAAGTEEVEVEPARRATSSLDEQQLDELRRLLVRIERFYGFPQDVEWAFAEGALYLLQSRPITRFPARWTRGESAERFPSPVTPLTWDFVVDGFHESLAFSLRMMGLPPFDGRWFDRFDGYVYGNETAVRLFTAAQQVAFDSLDALRALLPGVRERYQWVVQLPMSWARDLDWYLLSLGALAAVRLDSLSDEELWRHIEAIDAVGRRYFLPNIAISITHGVLHRMLFQLAGLLVGAAEGPALYDGLTCFCDTKTNLVNQDLLRLAEHVARTPGLRALLAEGDRRTLVESERLRDFPAFCAELDRFLANHGHREVDFDTYVPTWSGQPWVVLENVRLMVEGGELPDPAAREIALRERQQEAERRLVACVPEDLRYFALELVRLARAYTSLDDLEHYETTRLSVPFRRAIVGLGARLRDAGALAAAEDVFFLRRETVAGHVTGSVTAEQVASEAAAAKSAHESNRRRTPPFALDAIETVTPAAGDLRGMPGSPGVAEGSVFRLHGVEDFGRFPPGSVLVARTTNPAWTPLFHGSVAVITESGGPLSHGAVTAREVGIPAVMSVRGALGILRDGERVRVNGAAGTVTRLDDEQMPPGGGGAVPV